MKGFKLNKEKLNEYWKEGGRETSKWCNYYIEQEGANSFLVEKANWTSYIVYVISLPFFVNYIINCWVT